MASFRDPETYGALKQYLVRGTNRTSTHDEIKNLPGIQLGDTVAKGWEAAKLEGGWAVKDMARTAIAYGHVDALAVAVAAAVSVAPTAAVTSARTLAAAATGRLEPVGVLFQSWCKGWHHPLLKSEFSHRAARQR